jgi:hypothetical protein
MMLAVISFASTAEVIDEQDEDLGPDTETSTPATSSNRIYRTREEQRESGLQREITPWLKLSTLLEGELQHDRLSIREEYPEYRVSDDSATLQFGLTVDPLEQLKAELILEYDTEVDKFITDEAFVTYEYEPWELAIGKQYTPFGTYFSHFVTGPILEFAETRSRRAINLTYGPSDELDLSVALYSGRARAWKSHDEQWDWALSLETWPLPNLSMGMSYQSDLADADEVLLEETDNRYLDRISAISGYLLWIGREFEVTLEYLTATDDFQELESEKNRPMAWNAEFAYIFSQADIELAFRYEESRELDEAPRRQYGIALTRYEGQHASLTVEYLRAHFDRNFYSIEFGEDVEVTDLNHIGAKITFEF